MPRRALVIAIVAVVVAVVGLAGTALFVLAPWGTGRVAPSAVATGGSSHVAAPQAIDGGDIVWAEAFDLTIALEPHPGTYVLQAGVLGDREPRVDVEVPWAPGLDGGGIHRAPVGEPVAGQIVYVADDGAVSTVHRVSLAAPDEVELMGELPEVVWDLAVAPDGSDVFLDLVDREDTEIDLGVVRLALDGSAAIEPVLPPAANESSTDGLRLAAIARFVASVHVSPDGRYLARSTCRGPLACRGEVVDLGSGVRADLGPVQIHDLGAGGFAIVEACAEAGCRTQLMDLESGEARPLVMAPIETSMATVDGAPVVVTARLDAREPTLVATDPRSGERVELYRAADDGWLTLADATGTRWSIPDGWVLVVESRAVEGGGAVVREVSRHLLIPLDGGEPVEVPEPAIIPREPKGVQG
jgi:hypothetical protein